MSKIVFVFIIVARCLLLAQVNNKLCDNTQVYDEFSEEILNTFNPRTEPTFKVLRRNSWSQGCRLNMWFLAHIVTCAMENIVLRSNCHVINNKRKQFIGNWNSLIKKKLNLTE